MIIKILLIYSHGDTFDEFPCEILKVSFEENLDLSLIRKKFLISLLDICCIMIQMSVIRELVQNSLDAIRLQQVIDKKNR